MSLSRRTLLKASAATFAAGGISAPYVARAQGAEFTLSDGATFGVWQPDDEQFPIGAGIMFAVPDAKKAVEHYRSRGVELSDVMESRVCFMSFGTDPEGNSFMIHQRKNTD